MTRPSTRRSRRNGPPGSCPWRNTPRMVRSGSVCGFPNRCSTRCPARSGPLGGRSTWWLCETLRNGVPVGAARTSTGPRGFGWCCERIGMPRCTPRRGASRRPRKQPGCFAASSGAPARQASRPPTPSCWPRWRRPSARTRTAVTSWWIQRFSPLSRWKRSTRPWPGSCW